MVLYHSISNLEKLVYLLFLICESKTLEIMQYYTPPPATLTFSCNPGSHYETYRLGGLRSCWLTGGKKGTCVASTGGSSGWVVEIL